MSWSCDPFSMTKPLDMTAMMSEFWMVDRRWAMTMQVRPSLALSRAACTVCRRKHTHEAASVDTRRWEPSSVLPWRRQLYQFHNHALITVIRMLQCAAEASLSSAWFSLLSWKSYSTGQQTTFILKRLYWRVGMNCEPLVIIIEMMNDNDVNDNNN